MKNYKKKPFNIKREEKIKLLTGKQSFRNKVKRIKEKYGIPPTGYQKQTVNRFYKEREPEKLRQFRQEIIQLCNEEALTEDWQKWLHDYILHNIKKWETGGGYKLWIEFQKDSPRLNLQVYKDTRLADVQNQWRSVINAQTFLKGDVINKTTKKRKEKRDSRIIQLRKQGKTRKETVQIIREEFGEVLSEPYISTIIKRKKGG